METSNFYVSRGAWGAALQFGHGIQCSKELTLNFRWVTGSSPSTPPYPVSHHHNYDVNPSFNTPYSNFAFKVEFCSYLQLFSAATSVMGTDIPRYLVDRRDIPQEHQKLYDAAAESRLYSVKSLSHHPKDLEPEFIVTKPLEDQFIAKVEQSYVC